MPNQANSADAKSRAADLGVMFHNERKNKWNLQIINRADKYIWKVS